MWPEWETNELVFFLTLHHLTYPVHSSIIFIEDCSYFWTCGNLESQLCSPICLYIRQNPHHPVPWLDAFGPTFLGLHECVGKGCVCLFLCPWCLEWIRCSLNVVNDWIDLYNVSHAMRFHCLINSNVELLLKRQPYFDFLYNSQ